jgi:hypothetical protein
MPITASLYTTISNLHGHGRRKAHQGGIVGLVDAEVGRNESRGLHLLGHLDKVVPDGNVKLGSRAEVGRQHRVHHLALGRNEVSKKAGQNPGRRCVLADRRIRTTPAVVCLWRWASTRS